MHFIKIIQLGLLNCRQTPFKNSLVHLRKYITSDISGTDLGICCLSSTQVMHETLWRTILLTETILCYTMTPPAEAWMSLVELWTLLGLLLLATQGSSTSSSSFSRSRYDHFHKYVYFPQNWILCKTKYWSQSDLFFLFLTSDTKFWWEKREKTQKMK